MKTFVLFEGRNRNDNDGVREFSRLDRALFQFKMSPYPFAVLMEYDGTEDDAMANYVRTVCEKIAKAEFIK